MSIKDVLLGLNKKYLNTVKRSKTDLDNNSIQLNLLRSMVNSAGPITKPARIYKHTNVHKAVLV